MTNRDTWTPRDYPVLCAVADHLEETHGEPALNHQIAKRLPDLEPDAVTYALTTLTPEYIVAEVMHAVSGPPDVVVTGLTVKGRRAARLWPEEDSATEALVGAILAGAEEVDDEAERSRLRTAADALGKAAGRVTESAIATLVAGMVRGTM